LSCVSGENVLGAISAQKLVKDITEIVIQQQSESIRILNIIENELEKENIFIINEKQISKEQDNYIKDFFIQHVSPALVTIILNDLAEFPVLRDTSGYLAVKLVMKPIIKDGNADGEKKTKKEVRYAVIEMPRTLNRFVVLPSSDEKRYVIMLDDVIRYNLSSIFNIFDYHSV